MKVQNQTQAWLNAWEIPLLLLGIWLATVCLSLFMHQSDIAPLDFTDPDDAMRLVQVRDFLAGQSWFDVSQHRANPPAGGPMHWSRLVDLPIAVSILLLRPLLGFHWAEVGAVLIVPALTLAALLAALYWAVRPLLGARGAMLCCALFATSPMVLIQCAAMRIDHHGWQIVMMALVLGGTLHSDPRRGGLIAGLAMAMWLHISSEGLPMAAMIGGVIAARYVLDAREWQRMACYIWLLAAASAILLLITHGWSASLVLHCDAMSPVYLLPLAVMPGVVTAGHRLLGQGTAVRRMAPIGLAAGLAAAAFLVTGRPCLAGPFSALDPQVYEIWYKAVLEGLPIWMQGRTTASMMIVPPLLGLIGYAMIIRRESDWYRRRDWLTVLFLAAGATGLSILVMRTTSIAHLLAIPGNAYLFITIGKHARSLSSAVLRIPATASLVLLAPLMAVALTLPVLSTSSSDEHGQLAKVSISSEIAALDGIAPAVLFAPIDISPDILLFTRNSIIGTAHHRNVQGMKLVISAFLAAPEQAYAIVLGTSATYLLLAANSGEANRYRNAAPDGLAAQLLSGKLPPWLIPVPLSGLKVLSLYRIDRAIVPKPANLHLATHKSKN